MADHLEKDEYLDVSNNMRLYVNMRFAQLTLFVAITGVLLNVIFGKNPAPSPGIAVTLKIGGLCIALIFWVMEERAADFFHHYKRRAIELEAILGYKQYTKRPQKRWLTATNAVRAFFSILAILWLLSLFFPSWFS